MEKRQYAEEVAKIIAEKHGKVTDVVEVDKANGVHLTGITVRDEGDFAAPTFYVDDFYEDYGMDECARQIMAAFKECVPPPAIGTDMGYESIKDKVTVRLLDFKRNEEYLEKTVHKKMECGLALIIDINYGECYRAVVTEELARSNHYPWNIFGDAMENSVKAKPARLTEMAAALFGGDKNLLDGGEVKGGDMFVLTNDEGAYGSAVMFYPGVLERAREIIGCDYFVLPSSVHEVILVPDDGDKKAKDLKKMVVEANKTVVEGPDVLSDCVYRYDGELKVVA